MLDRTARAASQQRLILDDLPESRALKVRPSRMHELPLLADMLAENIPNLKGSYAAFERVHRQTRAVLSVTRSEITVGCFAGLTLSQIGLERLLAGALSMAEPAAEDLAAAGERAVGLYIWAAYMPSFGIEAMGNIMAWFRRPEYVGVDMYARPTTPQGRTFIERLGFLPVDPSIDDRSLWIGRRHCNPSV